MQEPTVLSSELNYVYLEHCVLSIDDINITQYVGLEVCMYSRKSGLNSFVCTTCLPLVLTSHGFIYKGLQDRP